MFKRISFRHLAIILIFGVILAGILGSSSPIHAATSLTIEPLTWNVIGLDSNSPTTGPKFFPVGARVCSPGAASDGDVTATFNWTSSSPYIGLRAGTASSINLGPLAADECADAYFEVEVQQVSAAYDQTREYTITASDSDETVSTPQPRELFVEFLISQNRNSTDNVRFGTSLGSLTDVAPGGTMNLVVGESYFIELTGGTATQGYEQFEQFLTLTNTIFQINSVTTDYAVNSSPYVTNPSDKLYADACLWENNPNSPNYRSCLSTGKTGGAPVVVTYDVTIIGGGGTAETLNSLLYDFSGSSFHYNSDFSASARFANIIDPASATIAKRFVPDTISDGGVSTLIFTLSNPNSGELSGYNFTDPLPAGMTVADPATFSTSGCGTPTFSPNVSDTSISFSNGTVAGNSTCTISVDVTAPLGTPTPTPYDNTTNNLFVGTLDTGNNASATLNVTADPPPPACTSGVELARWTMDPSQGTTTPPAASFISSQASFATASFTGSALPGVDSIDTTTGNPVNAWSGTGWQTATSPVTLGPGPSDPSYFEFTLDTSAFVGGPLDISVDINPTPTGNWATPSDITANIHASTDGGAFTTITSANPVTRSTWTTLTGTVPNPGSSDTTFRINISGRSNGNPDATFLIDNIIFTGCAVPEYPTLSKSFLPNPIAAGAVSTLTFTLINPNNGVALTNASFTDDLPTGVEVAATPNAATSCGGTWAPLATNTSLSFTGGTIPAGGSCTVAVDVTSSSPGPSTNVSGFISTTETGENNDTSGSAKDTLTVLSPPQIDKVFSPNPIVANNVSTLTFTITNSNQNDVLSGVAFTDTFPTSPDAMVVAATPNATSDCGGTWTATAGSDSVSLANGTIAGGSSCTLTVNVTGPTAGSYANTTSAVTHILNSTSYGLDTASDTLVANSPSPSISILKQVGTGDTLSDQWYSYLAVAETTPVYFLITIENTGDAPLSPVSVSDPAVDTSGCVWPATLPVADASDDDHIATCIVGPVSPVSGENLNTATASGTYNGTQYTDSDTVTYATAALTLNKAANPLTFDNAGEQITYTYTVTNSGSATLNGPVTITDDYIGTFTCSDVSDTNSPNVTNGDEFFDPSEQLVCTAVYTITSDDVAAGSVTNTASASAPISSAPGAAVITSPDATATVGAPDVTITKAVDLANAEVGDTLTYTIQATNNGGTAATNLVISDAVPANTSYVANSISGGDTQDDTALPNMSWTIASLPADGIPVNLTFQVTVDSGTAAGTTITNTADVVGDNVPSTTSNEVSTTVTEPSLTITKNVADTDNGMAEPGETLTYSLTVDNNGTTDANNVVITDGAPPNTSFVDGSGSVDNNPNSLTVTISDVGTFQADVTTFPGGATLTVSFQVTVNDPLPGAVTEIANTATVDSDEIDPTDSSTTTIPVNNVPDATPEPSPELLYFDPAISKVGILEPGALGLPGETLTWQVTVTNVGNGRGEALTISDTLREELQIENVTTERGSASVNGQTVTFNIPFLDPDESVQMQIVTTVLTSPLEGQFDNTVVLNGFGPDGAVVTDSGSAVVDVATGLPATGYAPVKDSYGASSPSITTIVVMILGLTSLLGSIVFVWQQLGKRQ